MRVYVFPDESQESFDASSRLQEWMTDFESDDKLCYLWPEAAMSFAHRKMFDPDGPWDVVITNDPFIISCFNSEVVSIGHVVRGRIKIEKPDFQTFGSSYDFILTKLFGCSVLVPDVAVAFIQKAVKSRSPAVVRDSLAALGESFEKRFLFERAYALESKKDKSRKT